MNRRATISLAVLAAALPLLAVAGQLSETPVPAAARSGLSLTVTQGGVALVRDRRPVALDRGEAVLVLEGVARTADGGSARLAAPGMTVREQAVEAQPLTAQALLAASLGREVTVVWRDGKGAEREERATVLATGEPPLFSVDGKVVAGSPVRVVHDRLPPGLRPQPSFTARVAADTPGRREVELTYLAEGLSWSAETTAELDGDRLAISTWANLTNAAGVDFPEAALRLVAGELNQPSPPLPQARGKTMMMAAMAPEAADAATAQPAGPHHLYPLPQPVALKDGESRQVSLFSAQLPVERELIFDPLPPHAFRERLGDIPAQHPTAGLRLTNDAKAGGGKPLPAGTIRVMERGKDGQLTLLGQDRLGPVPVGQSARIALGRAFDVTARRAQVDWQRISGEVTEAAWQARLANAGDRPAKVTVRERFMGEWLVVGENRPHRKEDAFTGAWTIEVPAKGEAVLEYRVRVKG